MQEKLSYSLPFLRDNPSACRWVKLQSDLLLAANTVNAYARGINDWLAFCHSSGQKPCEAKSDIVALYIRTLHDDRKLAVSTIRHRATIVRLYCDFLCEEGLRESNPVRRGFWKDGGKGAAGLVPVQRLLPWIPDTEGWQRFLNVAAHVNSSRTLTHLCLTTAVVI